MNENQLNIFEVKEDKPLRKFKITEEGNVEIDEIKHVVMKMSCREFLSFYRENEKQLESFKEQLSEENQVRIRDNMEYIEEEISKLNPILAEAEEKTRIHYNQLKLNGTIAKVKEELGKAKSERNAEYLMAVFSNLEMGDKDIVMHELSDAEKSEFAKLKLQVKRKKR
jgi:phosphatidate phosphatase PAH1